MAFFILILIIDEFEFNFNSCLKCILISQQYLLSLKKNVSNILINILFIIVKII